MRFSHQSVSSSPTWRDFLYVSGADSDLKKVCGSHDNRPIASRNNYEVSWTNISHEGFLYFIISFVFRIKVLENRSQ